MSTLEAKNIDEDAEMFRYRAYITVNDLMQRKLTQRINKEKENLTQTEKHLLEVSQADIFGNKNETNITEVFEFLLNEYKYKMIPGEALKVPKT